MIALNKRGKSELRRIGCLLTGGLVKRWKVQQKVNRLFKVRVKRWCKRLPGKLERVFAMQTPPGERSNSFV